MSDWPVVSARRFETFVRWSTYAVVTTPIVTLLSGLFGSGLPVGEHLVTIIVATVLAALLVVGNVLVSRRSVDMVVGQERRLPAAGVVAWAAVLVATVAALLTIPVPATGVTVAAAVGSAAASLVPVLDARRTLALNAAVIALAIPFAVLVSLPLLIVSVLIVSVGLWAGWSSVWTLRVLIELQSAHVDRAALALANERLRISRDLHDVFGRTLATIAVKSELASELVRRGRVERAADEMAEVRRLAGEAGAEVRRVVRGELQTTWQAELDGAQSLLGSAGIQCMVTGDPVPAEAANALAWVVREGVTNVLRHSTATRVTIATAVEDGEAQLTIANDGTATAPPSSADPNAGTGLRAMSERIRALGGRTETRRDGDWFLVDAVVPLKEGESP
ncbi:sensor histidine kinase [Dactylosporangium sp. NPDC048998]|uniref:sensor histidine kinase n=1 Tax=Dactylosporangium sp. NPDC048998 TaxID=3363976 RepID=UPI003715A4C4